MNSCPLSDLMTRQAESLPPEAPLGAAVRRMTEARISSIVVARDGRAVGILTETDVLQAMRAHRQADVPVSHVMTARVVVAAPDMEFRDAYQLAARHRVRHLVVVDADGTLLGVVTETDFRRQLGIDYFRTLQTVGALMDRRCPRLTSDAPLEAALRAMENADTACVVVDAAGKPLGILTERDVVRLFDRYSESGEPPALLGDVMTAPVVVVHQDAAVLDAASRMRDHAIRHLVVVDGQGAVSGILGQHHMITPLALEFLEEAMRTGMRLEEERDAAEERLRLIYESMEDGLWDMDMLTGKVYWNPRLYSMLGYAPDEFPVDIDIWRGLIHPEDVAGTLARFQASLAAGAPPYRAEYRLHRKDGSWLWVEARGKVLARDPEGRAVRRGGVTVDIANRKRAQETLLLMQRGVDQAPVSVVVTDPTGSIIYVNPYFCQVTGYAREEVIGQNPRLLKSGETPDKDYEDLWRTITTGQTWSGLLHNRRRDGSLYWERAVISPLRDGLGNITAYVGVKENITEQKRLEDELRTREHYLRALVDNFPFLVWLKDTEGRFLIVNRAFAEAVGAPSPDVMVGRTDLDYFPRELAERYRADDRSVMEQGGGLTVEETVVVGNLPTRHQTFKSPLLDDGRLLGTVGFARDVSGEKRLEEAIRQSRQLLLNVLAAATEVSIVATDLQGRITLFNPGAERLLGYQADEVVGTATPERFHDAAEVRHAYESIKGPVGRLPSAGEWIHALVDAGEGRQVEWTYVRRDGSRVPVLMTVTRMRDAAGVVTGYLGVAIDIRERKRLEQREHLRAKALEKVAGGARLAATLAGIIDEVEAMSPGWIPSVLLLAPGSRRIRMAIAPRLPSAVLRSLEGTELGDGVGSCGTAMARGERVVVDDIAAHPYWASLRDWAGEADVAACWSQPIFGADGSVLGSFGVYHRTPKSPGPDDVRVVEEAARLAG
ncbi:MAG: PAS domain S-box protein, partial [Rhodocyclaceae bacterium]|nr:PAS domain S-box protein [Rhodocyclaceae bacterium]